MSTPSEHKTVQARILDYAEEIGWTYVPRAEAETRRGFDIDRVTREARMLQQLTTAQIGVKHVNLSELRWDGEATRKAEGASNI